MHAWHDVPWGTDLRDCFHAIVEIPEGSKVKYELDKATGLLRADRGHRGRGEALREPVGGAADRTSGLSRGGSRDP